jgi:excisionase family DNA binding protein
MDAQRLFLSKREVAQLTGISEISVHRLTKSGKLASTKLGGRVLIPREAVNALVAQALAGEGA